VIGSFGLVLDLMAEDLPLAQAAGIGPKKEAVQAKGSKRQVCAGSQASKASADANPNTFRIYSLFGRGV
jgi:hypothetical protein